MFTFTAVALAAAAPVGGAVPADKLDSCDIVWTTPSKDAAGSMPIGNGQVVLNVWVDEGTGDLLFYIARTDAMSEISRYLKLGRIRVHFTPSPFLKPPMQRSVTRGPGIAEAGSANGFRQHLMLRQGRMEIRAGDAHLTLFVDADADVVRLRGSFSEPVKATATVECWRNAPREIPRAEQGSAWAVHDAPFKLVESADVFVPGGDAVTWYHRNETSVVPKIWENQSLAGLAGTFDPLIHRTFGGSMSGPGFERSGDRTLASSAPAREIELRIATHTAQTASVGEWLDGLRKDADTVGFDEAETRTARWWEGFWNRSWVFVEGDPRGNAVPKNDFPLRKGVDSNGENLFPGEIEDWSSWSEPPGVLRPASVAGDPTFGEGFTLRARIEPARDGAGRIFDKITAGGTDGFLFDMQPGRTLRLIVGDMTLTAPQSLHIGRWQRVEAGYDGKTGEASLSVDGKLVAHRAAQSGSPITRGYILQRFVQGVQGRGTYPIKFNGGYYTVEPKAMGSDYSPDWRAWGDCHWYQNVRHMYHPMTACGDIEMMEPFFKLYESVRKLAESRTKLYHGCSGAYFPETMTVYGTYSGGDYGWDRTGKQPKDVGCPYWQFAWNQGPELVALMLDRWDYTRDEAFLKRRVLPMAESVLRYFETRFRKDGQGRIVLDPTQAVETYWHGVVNDMPSTAGLIAVTRRLCELPARLVDKRKREFFEHMRAACPELPMEDRDGLAQLAPAQKYDPRTSNCENPELYGVWPFRVVSLAHPKLLEEAKRAYAHRLNHLDVGWGYDGNVAALLGMTNEAARILRVKCANSNPAYRWPATWGPNFDWLPDQNHGGNLLETADLMLLQCDPLEEGGAIRLLPAWPKDWDVDFKLHAPGNTVVACRVRGGRIENLQVTPPVRCKDIVLGTGWK